MLKNPQHDCVKTRGGGAVYTMCKKTSDLVEDGFPNESMFCNVVSFFGGGEFEL